MNAQEILDALLEEFIHMPVSYTHLDVYKRQCRARRRAEWRLVCVKRGQLGEEGYLCDLPYNL